jgi:hypothetical protein
MTWRELFRRAWLVLRLRFKRIRSCEECGDVKERIEHQSMRGTSYYEWKCPSCEEWARLERERQLDHGVCPKCGLKASGSWAFADTAYCVGVGGCGAIIRRGPNPFAAALQNASGAIDPALLQNQIGAPIYVRGPTSVLGVLGSAIGSAIGGVIGHNPLP